MLLLLELNKLELSKGLKHEAKVLFRNRKVDIADVETMKGDSVGLRGTAVGVADLTVLLRFGMGDDDGDTAQLLPSEVDGLGNGILVTELNVTNTAGKSVRV